MRSLKSIHRKAAKKRAGRRDFVKRRNINNNVPTVSRVEHFDRFVHVVNETLVRDSKGFETKVRKQELDGDGQPVLKHIGYKEKIVKDPVFLHHIEGNKHIAKRDQFGINGREIGMIQYPWPKKVRVANPKARFDRLVIREMDRSSVPAATAERVIKERFPHLAKQLEIA